MRATVLLAAATATLVHSATLPVAATSLSTRQQHQSSLCDLYAYWSGNGYELLNNLWGKDTATSGSQCTYLDSASNNNIQWRTTWT